MPKGNEGARVGAVVPNTVAACDGATLASSVGCWVGGANTPSSEASGERAATEKFTGVSTLYSP